MTEASSRAKANKRKGAAFEIDIVQFLRDKFLHAERLTKAGKDDEGDVVVRVKDLAVVLECKNEKSIDLSVEGFKVDLKRCAFALGCPGLTRGIHATPPRSRSTRCSLHPQR